MATARGKGLLRSLRLAVPTGLPLSLIGGEEALRGRRDVRFKEDYVFSRACIEQWFVAVERQLQPDESADGQ